MATLVSDTRSRPVDVVIGINYYFPHISGLTRTAQAVAEACVESGLSVKVVCSRHEESLPTSEIVNGVMIERVDVVGHVENGLLSPSLPYRVAKSARQARVLHLHLPMLEAGLIAMLARRTPRIVSYQCDFTSTSKVLRPIVTSIVDVSSRVAIRGSERVIVSSLDYARASRLAPSLSSATEIFPAVTDRRGGQSRYRVGTGIHFGFLGRLAPEKGLPELIGAFESADLADAVLLIAGPTPRYTDSSVTRLVKSASGTNRRIKFLGTLSESELKDFYASIDCFVLPSTNGLEAFGITQAEALVCNLPVIATNLPGARTLQQRFGNGILVTPGDVGELARALKQIAGLQPKSSSPEALLSGTSEYVELIRHLIADTYSRQ